jgi:Rho-type GTPase-activating protein 1/2
MDETIATSLNVPASKASKRRSINPGLRLAEQESLPIASNAYPHSPTPGSLYSPAFSADSAAPSPGLVTTGSMAAQAPSHTLPSPPSQNGAASWNEVNRGRPLVIEANQTGSEAHSISPTETPSSAGAAERSRSYTPVPSNVDASGRVSDDSETDGGPTLPPKLALNGVDQDPQSAPSPIQLSFHDDPAFSSLLTSFGGEAESTELSLRDPAGSRRSMQALANVALRLSEDSTLPNTPSTGGTVVQGDTPDLGSTPTENTIPEVPRTLPPIPKTSVDGDKPPSDESHGDRSFSDSRKPASASFPVLRGANSSVVGARARIDSNNSTSPKTGRPPMARPDTTDLVSRRLREALKDATDRGATAVKLDKEFVEAILHALQGTQTRVADMKGRLDGMKVRVFSPIQILFLIYLVESQPTNV